MAQNSNTSITPYEDLGVLHHNFENSVVVVEDDRAKKIHDNFDGAGPSGEGSCNDVAHPNRIERLHGDFDCEEYFERESISTSVAVLLLFWNVRKSSFTSLSYHQGMHKPLLHIRQIRVTAGKYQGKCIQIKLSRRFPPDKVAWAYSPSGLFTTSSAYKLLVSDDAVSQAGSSNVDTQKHF
nr:hypothetical protein CFP56_04963 [Quercus suber]